MLLYIPNTTISLLLRQLILKFKIFSYIITDIPPSRVYNPIKTNTIRSLGLGYIFYIYITIRNIEFDSNIPLKIYYLLLLGTKVRYIRYEYSNTNNKYNIINLIFF